MRDCNKVENSDWFAWPNRLNCGLQKEHTDQHKACLAGLLAQPDTLHMRLFVLVAMKLLVTGNTAAPDA